MLPQLLALRSVFICANSIEDKCPLCVYPVHTNCTADMINNEHFFNTVKYKTLTI